MLWQRYAHVFAGQFCACGLECPNRASQKPRTIPVEIFKTKMRGWGVRFTKRVAKGQVLGFYTGFVKYLFICFLNGHNLMRALFTKS